MRYRMVFTGVVFNILLTRVVKNLSQISKPYGNICGSFIKTLILQMHNLQVEKDRRQTILFAHLKIVTGKTKNYQKESICKTFVPNISEISIDKLTMIQRQRKMIIMMIIKSISMLKQESGVISIKNNSKQCQIGNMDLERMIWIQIIFKEFTSFLNQKTKQKDIEQKEEIQQRNSLKTNLFKKIF